MARLHRTNQELLNASEQLHYEYSMLLRLSQLLEIDAFGDGVIQNALLESFIRRFYNLAMFLYPRDPQPEDVIAGDFYPEQEDWKSFRPRMSNELKKARRRAESDISGLAYRKGPANDGAWRYGRMVDMLEYVFRRFLATCPPDNLSRIWDGIRDMYVD